MSGYPVVMSVLMDVMCAWILISRALRGVFACTQVGKVIADPSQSPVLLLYSLSSVSIPCWLHPPAYWFLYGLTCCSCLNFVSFKFADKPTTFSSFICEAQHFHMDTPFMVGQCFASLTQALLGEGFQVIHFEWFPSILPLCPVSWQ
jgi:hypothetical protein